MQMGSMQHLGVAIILAAICFHTPKISANNAPDAEDVTRLMTLEAADPQLKSTTNESPLLSRVARNRGRVNKPERKSCNEQVRTKTELELKNGTNFNASIETKINETINMFLTGESKITLSSSDEVIVILGISGSGKSTLLQFLTGDNEKLIGAKICNTMIIKDSNNKIGSSIKSHTKIPELGVDEYGNNFYDCPGFKDTNDAIYDIASSYFIKKVFDNAKKVKILLTISHSKVKHGNDRGGFISLADHIFDLIPNLYKFNNSIALIVTKVDKIVDNYDYNDMPFFLSDEEKIENIADFLEQVKRDYEDLVALKGTEKVDKMSKLIDILVTRDTDGNLTRIGLFDRPFKAGPISKDKKLQESKENIQFLINNNLQYSNIENSDIQYSISDNSKLYLNDFKEAILETINLRKFELNKAIATSYLYSYEDISKITQFQTEFSSVIKTFLEVGNENYLESYIKLRNVLKAMNKFDADQDILKILNLIKFLNLLQNFAPSSNFTLSKHISDFSNIGHFLENLQNWFLFMKELTLHYSAFEMQKEKQNYQIEDGEVRRIKNYKEEIVLTKSNFSECLEKLSLRYAHAKISYEIIISTEPSFNDLLYQQVFDIINYTMRKSDLEIKTASSEIYVIGEFVRLSEVMKLITKNNQYSNFNSIIIFAYNKIMIDVNVVLNNGKNLTIIAPVWEVVSFIEIKLQGENAAKHKQITESTRTPGHHGANGDDGHDGHDSGNFVGIGNDIINPQQLTIITQGGEGGNGQNGENGHDGKSGEPSSIFTNRVQPYVCNNRQKSHREFSKIAHEFNCFDPPYDSEKFIIIIYNALAYQRDCTLYGDTGSEGGNGGNGGSAGRGGVGGSILLQFSNNNNHLSIETKIVRGDNGQPGKGGKGGKGGQTWVHEFTALNFNTYYIIKLIKFHEYCFSSLYNTKRIFNSGRSGSPGRIITNSKQKSIKIENLPNILRQYKNQAYPKIIHGNNKDTLSEFLAMGFNGKDINKYYSLLDFIYEIMDLEKMELDSKQNLNTKRLYDSLFKRFLVAFKHISDSDGIQLKAYINSIFLSQAYTTNVLKLRHVTDISALITFVKEKIKLYEKSDLERLKSITKVEFTSQIKKKINESHDILQNQIKLQQKSFESDIETALLTTIEDIEKLQKQGEQFKDELVHKEKEINKKIEQLQVLSIVGKISNVLGVFYPIFNSMAQVEQQYFKFTETVNMNIINPVINDQASSLFRISSDRVNSATEVLDTEKIDNDDFMTKLTANLQQKRFLMENEVKHIKAAIGHVNANNERLASFMKEINENLVDYLNKMKSDYIRFVDQLENSNRVQLDVRSLEIKTQLKHLKEWIIKITEKFNVEKRFIDIINNVETSIDLLITLHDDLEIYNQEQNMLNYLSIISASSDMEMKFTDPMYSNAIINMENIIHSNVILSLYNQILTTVKQYVFPFAESYVHFEHVSNNFSSTSPLAHEKTNSVVQQINHIADELTRKRATIVSGQDKDIFTGDFHSKFIISDPFHVWTDDDEIMKFLSGEEITLKSNIFAPKVKNAVKFNYIALDIKTKMKDQQNTLDYILNQFIIRMKHSGNSLYKCDTKYFEIKSDTQVFEYSYEKQNNKTPVYQNEIYRKISAGDLLLSPYTEWKLQLIDTKENGFDELRDYFHSVSVNLVGSGQYLRDNAYICETNLEKFYTLYNERDKQFHQAVHNLEDTIELEAVY